MADSPHLNPQQARRARKKCGKKKKKEAKKSLYTGNEESAVEIEENKKKRNKKKKKSTDTISPELQDQTMTEAEADAVRQKLWPSKPAGSDDALKAARIMNLSAEQAEPMEPSITAREQKITKKADIRFPLEESPLKLKLENYNKLIDEIATVKERHKDIHVKVKSWEEKYEERLKTLKKSVHSSEEQVKNELEYITYGIVQLEKLVKKNQGDRANMKEKLRKYAHHEQTSEGSQSFKGYVNQTLINLLCSLLLYIALLRDYISGNNTERNRVQQLDEASRAFPPTV